LSDLADKYKFKKMIMEDDEIVEKIIQ